MMNRPYMAVALVLILGGCSADPAKQKAVYRAKAESYLKQGMYAEATIELRNAAQVDAQDAEVHLDLAQAYLRTGQVQKAREEYRRCLALRPEMVQAQGDLAALLLSANSFDEAKPLIESLLQDTKNSRAHLLQAQYLFGTQQINAAIDEYRAAIAMEPLRTDLRISLSAVLLAAGQIAKAKEELLAVVHENPKSVEARMGLAQFYLSQDQPNSAEEQLQVATLDPKAIAPWLLLGEVYLRTGRVTEAERLFVRMKREAPEDPRVYSAMGALYASTGQRGKAIIELSGVLAEHEDLGVRQSLVELMLDAGRLVDAENLNAEVLKAFPKNPRAMTAEGRILMARQRNVEAAVKFEAITRAIPQGSEGFYWLGQAQRNQGLTKQAEASLKEALRLNPRLHSATVSLAEMARSSGNIGRAEQLVKDAAESRSGGTPLLVEQARILSDQGRSKAAEVQLLRVLESNPLDVTALTDLVRLYGQIGRSGEVIRRISGLINQHENDANLYFLLGLSQFNARELAAASASAQRALELNKNLASAYTLRANIDLRNGDLNAAKEDLRHAIKANPRTVTNYMALENILKQEGRWDEATRLCEEAFRVSSSSPEIGIELAFLYLDHGGDAHKALALAQDASRRLPEQAAVSDTLGWAFYKTGLIEAAVRELKKGTEKAPTNIVYSHHLGMAYMAAGKPDLARHQFEFVAKENPAYARSTGVHDALAKLILTN